MMYTNLWFSQSIRFSYDWNEIDFVLEPFQEL